MKIKGFTIVPDFMIQKYGYVGGLIYGKIARYCEWSEMNVCTASNSRLATELNMGESTIRKYKQRFEEDGLMVIVGKSGDTDTVSIIEEMVLEMYTPLPDSTPPLLDSDPTPLPRSDKDIDIKDTNKDIASHDYLSFVLSKKNNPLDGYPVEVVPYLDAFIEVFKRNPAVSEKAFWIKTAREWRSIGVKAEDVSGMYALAKEKGLTVKSPASITFAFDEMRTHKDPLALSATERGAVEVYE